MHKVDRTGTGKHLTAKALQFKLRHAMASNTVDIDDTDSRFDYKDESWQLGFAIVAFNSTFHTTSTAGAQVVFGPFYGELDFC